MELVSVEEGLSEPLPDELCDITAQHLVKFSKLNPFTYMQKKVTVKNTTSVITMLNRTNQRDHTMIHVMLICLDGWQTSHQDYYVWLHIGYKINTP